MAARYGVHNDDVIVIRKIDRAFDTPASDLATCRYLHQPVRSKVTLILVHSHTLFLSRRARAISRRWPQARRGINGSDDPKPRIDTMRAE